MNTCGFGWCASVFACANQTSPGAENRCRSMGVAMLCSTSPTLSSETLPPQGHRERERERERQTDIGWSVWGRKKVKDQYGNQRCLKSRNRACVCFSHFRSPCSLSLSLVVVDGLSSIVHYGFTLSAGGTAVCEAGQISRASQDILPASYTLNIQTRLFAMDLWQWQICILSK